MSIVFEAMHFYFFISRKELKIGALEMTNNVLAFAFVFVFVLFEKKCWSKDVNIMNYRSYSCGLKTMGKKTMAKTSVFVATFFIYILFGFSFVQFFYWVYSLPSNGNIEVLNQWFEPVN